MLDIQFIRDNPDLVEEKSKQKGYKVNIKQLLELDKTRRIRITALEQLQSERNEFTKELKGKKPNDQDIQTGKEFKQKIAGLEKELSETEAEYQSLLKAVPNMPFDSVPVGASEDENQVAKTVGEKTTFSFTPKTHAELATNKDWLDKERAAKVSGSRFAYLKGDLVKLQFAIIQFVFKTLGDEQVIQKLITDNKLNLKATPFTPVLPPYMLKTDVYEAMDRLDPRDDRYKVGEDADDLWLQGSAEHVLGSMYYNEVLPEANLPIRYVGYATSFRREAGTYGKDTEGIIRMHQFDKLEMEVISTAETGPDEHKLLIAIQEYLVQQLKLPYQLIQKCTADIGKPNASGVDIDTWMPGQGKYRETHTADYMTDYQARRLKTRVKTSDGQTQFVHTNDATAFALGRIMVAIMENYQTADGNVNIPEVLKPFM